MEERQTKWTVCDETRTTKEYWDARLKEHWDKPYHGMFFDSQEVIDKMDFVNRQIIVDHLHDVHNAKIHSNELKNPKNGNVKILDIGCGDGRYFPIVSRAVEREGLMLKKYVGVDYGDLNIQAASQNYAKENVEWRVGDARSVATYCPEDKFDMIFMVSVVTSIERDLVHIMDNLMKMTTPYGKVFIFEQDWYLSRWR